VAYEYDVYMSYSRRGSVPTWLFNHFLPKLRDALTDEMSTEPRIFVDQNLATGTAWPANMERALLRSRLMVALFSPAYFRSQWCLAEWMTIADRERAVGDTHGLIIPVLYAGGTQFPDYARERRWADFKAWNVPDMVFSQTLAYGEFHRAVGQLAADIVRKLETVPEWDDTWQVVLPGPVLPSTPPSR
jgi:hypothetical protein